MTTFLAPSLVERIGWVLLHSVWQFVVVGLVLFAALLMLRRASATTRYAAGLLAITAIVAAPIVTWIVRPYSADSGAGSPVTAESSPIVADVINPPAMRSEATELSPATPALTADSPAAPAEIAVHESSSGHPEPSHHWQITLEQKLRPWLPAIVLAWCLGVLAFAFRPLLSWRRLRWLRRSGVSPVPGHLEATLRQISQRLGVRRAVSIVQSTLVQVPVVVGYLRPAILLPVSVLAELPASQLEAILAHELAHVRRHDFLVNLLQTLVETVFFYHPVVWWVSRQIRNERENCCDDIAVAVFGDRAEYGRALLALEELRGAAPVLSMGARDGSLLRRVRRLFIAGELLNDGAPGTLSGHQPRRFPRLLELLGMSGPAHRGAGWIVLVLALSLIPGIWFALPRTNAGSGLAFAESPANGKKVPRTDSNTKQFAYPKEVAVRVVGPDGKPMLAARLVLIEADSYSRLHELCAGAQAQPPAGNGAVLASSFKLADDGTAVVTLPHERPEQLALVLVPDDLDLVPMQTVWHRWVDLPDRAAFAVQRGATIGGRIMNDANEPIPGVQVTIGVRRTETDRDGRWRIRGFSTETTNWSIRCKHPEYVSDYWEQQLDDNARATLLAGTYERMLRRGIRIRGMVADSAGKPVPGAVVCMGGYEFPRHPDQPTTDENGAFSFGGCDAVHATLTAAKPGIGVGLVHIDIPAVQNEVVTIRLAPPTTVRLRIVYPDGQPVSGARVMTEKWRDERSEFLQELTDWSTGPDGRWIWNWAPDDAVKYEVAKVGYMRIPEHELVGGGDEVTLVLHPALRIRGTVTDARTGRAVPKFRAVPVIVSDDGRRYPDQSHAVDGADGQFELSRDYPYPAHSVRIEAAGYLPGDATEVFKSDAHEVTSDIRLTPAEDISGLVVDATGRALSDATVYLLRADEATSVYNGIAPHDAHNRASARTNAEGRYAFPPTGVPTLAFVIHESGLGSALADGKETTTIQLAPWARIEGTLKIGREPARNESIGVRYSNDFNRVKEFSRGFKLYFNSQAVTDAEGQFVFPRVPPGDALVHREISVKHGTWSTVGMGVFEPARLVAGETAHVALGGNGRVVIGRLVKPARAAQLKVDWGANPGNVMWGELHPPRKDLPEEIATSFRIESDGSFHIDDLPAGEFALRVDVYEPWTNPDSREWRMVGHCHVKFEVPDGSDNAQPVDLQEIEIQVADDALKPAVPEQSSVDKAFEPFDCVVVDAATGEPIPGNDFTIHFLFKRPATADAPEETIDNLVWGPKATSRFEFIIPERSLKHPDRDKLVVRCGVSHPDYEAFSLEERIPLGQILRDDPKSARDTFRRVALQRKKPQPDGKQQAARIVVTYNIRDAEAKTRIYVQHVNGKGDIGTEEVGPSKFNPLENGKTLTLPDLAPGAYQVARYRQLEIGRVGMSGIHTGMYLDRRQFKLQAGETRAIEFTRPNGKTVSGRVDGLKKFGLDKVIVCICSENAADDNSLDRLDVTIFDARHTDAEGRFTSEPLSPGKYVILVNGYAPFKQEDLLFTGYPVPRYIGTGKVTVPETGDAQAVEVTLRDTQAPEAADAAAASRAAAIAAIDKLGGEVQYDSNNPDKPVIAVSFFKKPDVVDSDLASLEPLTSLLEVVLTGTGVTDAGLEHLSGLANLGSLALTRTKITDAGLVHLKGLSHLEILELQGTAITDAGLAHLAGLTRLNMLLLSDTAITDKGLAQLQTLSRLYTLDLGGTAVTDAGLEAFKGLTSLYDLRLGRTKVSDAGLEQLQKLTNLKTLVLDGTQISPSGLNRLRAALPECKVYPQPAADLQSSIRFNVFDETGEKAITTFRVIPGFRRMVGDPDDPTWQENDARRGQEGELLWPLKDLLADEAAFLVVADGYKPQVWKWVRKADGPMDLYFTLAKEVPGSLLLDCRIEGGTEEYTFQWNLFKPDEPRPGVLGESRNVTAKNGQQTEFRNLIPGMYQLWRVRPIRFPDFTRHYALDYREVHVAAEKQTETRFVRGAGHRVRGRILGLQELVGPFGGGDGSEVPGRPADNMTLACVLVRAVDSPDPEMTGSGFREPTFDVAPANPDGRFETEPLEPGTYKLFAHAYRRLTEQERVRTGDILPNWFSSATVTVPADGEPEAVEITLQPIGAGTEESGGPRQPIPSGNSKDNKESGDDSAGGENQSRNPRREPETSAADKPQEDGHCTLTVEARSTEGIAPPKFVARLWRRAEAGAEPKETIYDSDWSDPQTHTLWRQVAQQTTDVIENSAFQFRFDQVAVGEYRASVYAYATERPSVADPSPCGSSDSVTVTEETLALTVPVTLSGDRSLVVKVVDAETREPIDGVPLTLFRSDGLPILTGNGGHGLYGAESDGKTWRSLAPGDYQVRVFDHSETPQSRIDYGPLAERVPVHINDAPETVITIAIPPRHLTEAEYDERWPFWIYGRITDPNGDPVADADLIVHTGIGTLRGGGAGKSDAEGHFKVHFVKGLTDLSPDAPLGVGTQVVVVRVRRAGFILQAPPEGTVLEMSDGPPEEDENDPKTRRIVRPGRPVEINFTLQPVPE